MQPHLFAYHLVVVPQQRDKMTLALKLDQTVKYAGTVGTAVHIITEQYQRVFTLWAYPLKNFFQGKATSMDIPNGNDPTIHVQPTSC